MAREKIKQKDLGKSIRMRIKNTNIYFYIYAALLTKEGKLQLDGSHNPLPDTNKAGHLLYALPGGGRWNSVLNKRER